MFDDVIDDNARLYSRSGLYGQGTATLVISRIVNSNCQSRASLPWETKNRNFSWLIPSRTHTLWVLSFNQSYKQFFPLSDSVYSPPQQSLPLHVLRPGSNSYLDLDGLSASTTLQITGLPGQCAYNQDRLLPFPFFPSCPPFSFFLFPSFFRPRLQKA